MSTVIYNKLVRDHIPQIIKQYGDTPHIRVAKASEMREYLHAKLQEEVSEFLADGDARELADVMEVLHALCAAYDVTMQDVETWRAAKALERGGFEARIVLESVDERA